MNISESGKVNNFLGVYYKWGHGAKGTYAKITMYKDVKKVVEGYKNYNESDLKVQKTTGDPETTLSKSDLKGSDHINNYSSFLGQLMWNTTKVGPDRANVSRYLMVYISYPGPEHWKVLGRFIGHLKDK